MNRDEPRRYRLHGLLFVVVIALALLAASSGTW